MQEVFEKIKKRIMIVATEACGYTPMTRVVSEAELKEIVEDADAEYNNGWIPYDEPPKNDDYVLLSFENVSVPLIGRYEEDAEGGAYYIGDEDRTCASQNVIVNAWQALPEQYNQNVCTSDCPLNDKKGCLAAEGCAGFEPRKQTNAVRIRFMSDEELAKFIAELSEHCLAGVGACDCSNIKENPCYKVCEKVAKDWLQSEVEE